MARTWQTRPTILKATKLRSAFAAMLGALSYRPERAQYCRMFAGYYVDVGGRGAPIADVVSGVFASGLRFAHGPNRWNYELTFVRHCLSDDERLPPLVQCVFPGIVGDRRPEWAAPIPLLADWLEERGDDGAAELRTWFTLDEWDRCYSRLIGDVRAASVRIEAPPEAVRAALPPDAQPT